MKGKIHNSFNTIASSLMLRTNSAYFFCDNNNEHKNLQKSWLRKLLQFLKRIALLQCIFNVQRRPSLAIDRHSCSHFPDGPNFAPNLLL